MTPFKRSDNDLLTALKHPMRRQILREMSDDGAISPRELASSLDEPLSNVSYHVRVLARCKAVVLIRTKAVRGSVQHFYRRNVKEPWARAVLELDDDNDDSGESRKGPGT